MQNIVHGAELAPADEKKPVDQIVGDLLGEIKARRTKLLEDQAYIENFPVGNEYQPDEDQRFNGIEQLRNLSRTNYAHIITEAVTSKCSVEGFRTAVANDENGDKRVKELFDRDDMGFQVQDLISLASSYSRAYVYVDPSTGRQRVVPPNNAAVLLDAAGEPTAAVVVSRDRALNRDTLRVFIREVNSETGIAEGPLNYFIATREIPGYPIASSSGEGNVYRKGTRVRLTDRDYEVPLDGMFDKGWVWWKKADTKGLTRVPVTALLCKDGKNEFEVAKESIDRANHMLFQRVIIITMQAFRQRAVKGNFPKRDANGRDIDYGQIFEPGPGSLWQLPEGADLWESQTTDIHQILDAVRADEKSIGAETKTPMNHFSDSVNNSAEGAASQKEAFYDKIEDRHKRYGSRLKRHISILLEANGEAERSRIEDLEVIWGSVESLSLVEKTAAFASLKGQGLSVKTALREGMKFKPEEVQRAVEEMNEDLLRNKMAESLSKPTPLAKSSVNGGQGNAKAGASNPVGQTSESLTKAREEGRKANG